MWLWLLGAGALFTVVAVMVIFVPLALVPSEGLAVNERVTAENNLRTTLVQFAGGSILLFGTALTLYINREGQITERFTRAIDQLGETGKEKLDVRLGGIYALERIARSSISDRGPIIEVLTAFLREHARWKPNDADTQPRLRADFQAVATVLGRNQWSRRHHFNLREVDLRYANLVAAHLERADFALSHLEEAWLTGAHMEGAVLRDAHLEGAVLRDAHLEGADFNGAHLEEANFTSAHLEGADLRGAHLEGAFFGGANLERANFTSARLEGVLGLGYAHLDRVIGLDAWKGAASGREENNTARSETPAESNDEVD